MFTVKNHWLAEDAVRHVISPNHGGKFRAPPGLLVMHYTGAPSFSGALRTLTDGKAQNRVSAHVLIGEDGKVAQLVPFDTVAWHAGVSSWKGRKNCNEFAIGVELVNSGLVGRLASGGYYDRLTHKAIAPDRVEVAPHKNGGGDLPWETYTPAQIAAAIAVASAICRAYGIREIVGHDDVAPGRKIDPGPAWPMTSFVSRVLGRGGDPALKASAPPKPLKPARGK